MKDKSERAMPQHDTWRRSTDKKQEYRTEPCPPPRHIKQYIFLGISVVLGEGEENEKESRKVSDHY